MSIQQNPAVRAETSGPLPPGSPSGIIAAMPHFRPLGALILCWLAAMLAACSASAFAHVSPTADNASTPAPLPPPYGRTTVRPNPSPTYARPDPSPTLAPALTAAPACLETAGKVVTDSFASARLQTAPALRLYLPPCYAHNTAQAYPVLYLLHGQDRTEAMWDDLGVDETADALIASGDISPILIVMPRDTEKDVFGDAVVQELIPYIDSHYRTLPDRSHRALGGISRGAGWAVNIGLQHPHLFSALGLHSLAIFYTDDASVYRWISQLPADRRPRIFIDVGIADPLRPSAEWLDAALTDRSVPHDFHLYPGFHDERYWTQHIAEYLRWYTAEWK
nr:esterase family protein [Chloroflexota bacterium]